MPHHTSSSFTHFYSHCVHLLSFFFFNDTATTEIYTLSLHDALPIWVRRARRHDPAGAALSVAPWPRLDDLDELDHDAERPLGMEECLSPVGVRVIVADDRVPRCLRVLAHPAEARDDERHVVDAGPALREEAVEEPVGAARLEDLEATPVLEAPLRERVGARGSAVRGGSAQLADEERRSVGEARHGDRDMIEATPSHPRLAQDGERAAFDQGEVDLGAEI